MARTRTEDAIRHQQRRGGILLPMIEDLFKQPIEIESQDDIDFIVLLLESQMTRQQDRTSNPLFSPSQLAECLRYVYLLKNHKELEIPKLASVRIEPNFYFFNGNWLHIKWQFALFKLAKKINDPAIFTMLGVEVPIVSKHKDHGGTVDALCLVYTEPIIVDFKGLNVRTFSKIAAGNVPEQYLVQLADYGMLWNAAAKRGNGARITRALLMAENKGGPDKRHPIALHEAEVEISTYLPNVRSRLEDLREHARQEKIPEPACVSTSSFQFQGCPFRKFCRQEVQAVERRNRRAASKDSEGYRVATPGRRRNHRARRNSNGR